MTSRGPKRGSRRLARVAPAMMPTRERHEGEPGLQGRVVQRALEVVGQRQEGPEERGAHQQRGQEGPATVAVEDHPERQQRVLHPLLDDHEGHQEDGGRGEQHDRHGRAPAVGPSLGEAVDEGEQATGHGHGAGDVVAVVGRGPALGDVAEGRHGRHDGDRHVDQEGPAPRGELGQESTEDEADGGSAAGDAAVDGERAGPLLGLGEGHGEQRQGGGRHDRGECPLQGTGTEEHGRVLGQATQGGGGGEADQADDEHPLAPEVVGDPAAQEEQAGEGQRVGRQHPLAVGRRDVQGPLGGRQGDDHHRGVEHHHELGHGDDRQGPEALGIEIGRRLGRLARKVECRCHGGLRVQRGSVPTVPPAALTWKGLVFWAGMAYNRNRSSGSI